MAETNSILLVWFAATNELFQVQWTSVLPPNWNTFTNIISYSTFQSPTNSKFTFLDDGSQAPFTSGRYYRLIHANSGASSFSVIPLTNGVPFNFTTGAGLTNFFSFDITQTNAAVLFEVYNLTGNGDLTVQRSNLPVLLPDFASTNAGTNYEQVVVRTNGSVPNLNAISWFLGVPNQSSNPISYTIRAVIPTNGILVSGLPLGTTSSRPGGSNVQLRWGPTVNGEKYEVLHQQRTLVAQLGRAHDSGCLRHFNDFHRPNDSEWWAVLSSRAGALTIRQSGGSPPY